MEEPRKEENQNTGEENQNQSGLPVRSCMLMCLAGIYLLYTGYKLCKNVIDGVDGGAWYFMVAGIAFLVIGAGMLFYGGKNVIKDDKEKRAKEAEEKARLAKEAAAAGNAKKSISDRANLVKDLNERKTEREEFVQQIVAEVSRHMKNAHIRAKVYGRVKHFFSIYYTIF